MKPAHGFPGEAAIFKKGSTSCVQQSIGIRRFLNYKNILSDHPNSFFLNVAFVTANTTEDLQTV